jgi:hypothetical protein
MPLQNRVDPFGTIHAIAARGTMMGNRGGRIHDAAAQTLNKHYASKRWICCVCDFRGRKRNIMGDSYTELFFLDEVTAFGAGHRPCAECRRADFDRFTSFWRSAFSINERRIADAIDTVMHAQRCVSGHGSLTISKATAADLPDGSMLSMDGRPFVMRKGRAFGWSFDGYSPPSLISGSLSLLTPPCIVKVFESGYLPKFHSSAEL